MTKPTITKLEEQKIAAHILQSCICDAVCSSDSDIMSSARNWLHITGEPPSIDDIVNPEPGSFIGVTRMLGLNWRWLRKIMRLAVVVETIPTALVTKKHLSLVHNAELTYNKLYGNKTTSRTNSTGGADRTETNYDSNGARKAKRCKHFLYLQAVPTTRGPS